MAGGGVWSGGSGKEEKGEETDAMVEGSSLEEDKKAKTVKEAPLKRRPVESTSGICGGEMRERHCRARNTGVKRLRRGDKATRREDHEAHCASVLDCHESSAFEPKEAKIVAFPERRSTKGSYRGEIRWT
ncbi:hypothetical protein KM043_003954 [Ampulex compressa]|nr:hypothetical protein KM043_003954 [Ampulex compressa]